MIAPKMTAMPSWPRSLPIAIIGVTPANETPLTKGSRAPIFQKPRVWSRVAMPAVKRLAPIRKAVSLAVRPTAGPTIMGGATTPAYIAATCWRPLVNIFSGGRVSSTGCFRSVRLRLRLCYRVLDGSRAADVVRNLG